MAKYITLIGSRDISEEEENKLVEVAEWAHKLGFILRSGGAEGSDSTINHLTNIEIYIPWNGFNGFRHNGKTVFSLNRLPDQDLAQKRAIKIHPRPNSLSQGALKLHTRNIYQVIGFRGQDGVKSEFVVYCADDDIMGWPMGGTRTAVKYAKELGIPTFNIRNVKDPIKELTKTIVGLYESN